MALCGSNDAVARACAASSQVLLVAPARLRLSPVTEGWGFTRDAPALSSALAPRVRAAATALHAREVEAAAEAGEGGVGCGVAFLDAGALFEIPDPFEHGGDGIHISAENAAVLGRAVAHVVQGAI